jgi:hypothetical protein
LRSNNGNGPLAVDVTRERRRSMTRLLGTAAAIAILGAGLSGAALAQIQTYQPNPYPQTFAPRAMPQQRYPTYPEGPSAYSAIGSSQPQYGTSSYQYPPGQYPPGQYPPGPGGQWQQSYQRGARPEISGSVTVPPGVATSSGSTLPNPAYMPSAAQYGIDGGVTVPYYSGR